MASYVPNRKLREDYDVSSSECKCTSALLVIDMQNYTCHPKGKCVSGLALPEYFWTRLDEVVVPNTQKLLKASRSRSQEVIYTNIECQTLDCRDNSLDYKVSGLVVPKGSWDAKVIDQIKPEENEIVLPKTSCNVFVSTNLDYVLRCLGVGHLIVCGGLTDQCIDACVRTGADLGYVVTLAEDCCITHSEQRQRQALDALKGFCRIRSADEIITQMIK